MLSVDEVLPDEIQIIRLSDSFPYYLVSKLKGGG